MNKKPNNKYWTEIESNAYQKDNIYVTSDIAPGDEEYYLGVSKYLHKRCTDKEIESILKDFNMTGADEYITNNSYVRHFFFPIKLN